MSTPRTALVAAFLSSVATAQVALYDAGTAGNPAVAPDPTSLGWTLTDPSGGQVGLGPVSPDPGTGLNTWNVDDQATFNGGRAHYGALFSASELANAADQGWRLSTMMRVLNASGIDVFYEFATGTAGTDDRYLVFFTLAGNDVVADVFLSGITYVCPGGNDGSYHEYAIEKLAGGAQLDGELYFDGALLGVLPRAASNGNAPNGGVHWGSGSSPSTASVNFHRVEFAPLGFGPIGTSYCGPALPNSSGNPAEITATGSSVAGGFPLTLVAASLPVNQFGYFLVGRTQGFFSPPGSQGFICLSGNIGRYNAASRIGFSGPGGTFDLAVDTTAFPVNPPAPGLSGETWNFQCWFRDNNPALTSNFTDGLTLTFL